MSAYLSRPLLQVKNWRFSAKTLLIPLIAAAWFLQACSETKRVATFIPTPPERLVCEQAGTRPTIPPEAVIAWENIKTVPQAKAVHDGYVESVRAREGVVANYVLKIEGINFTCWSNMLWRKDFEAGIPPR